MLLFGEIPRPEFLQPRPSDRPTPVPLSFLSNPLSPGAVLRVAVSYEQQQPPPPVFFRDIQGLSSCRKTTQYMYLPSITGDVSRRITRLIQPCPPEGSSGR